MPDHTQLKWYNQYVVSIDFWMHAKDQDNHSNTLGTCYSE